MRFFGGQPIFYSVLAFKTIDAQMFFWSVFLKSHKKSSVLIDKSSGEVYYLNLAGKYVNCSQIQELMKLFSVHSMV